MGSENKTKTQNLLGYGEKVGGDAVDQKGPGIRGRGNLLLRWLLVALYTKSTNFNATVHYLTLKIRCIPFLKVV